MTISKVQWASLCDAFCYEPFKGTVIWFGRMYYAKAGPPSKLAFHEIVSNRPFQLPDRFNSKEEVAAAFYEIFSKRKVRMISEKEIAEALALQLEDKETNELYAVMRACREQVDKIQ